MAPATRLPIKTITFSAVTAIGAIAARANLQNLFISTFTGPGSLSRIIAAVVVLANLKNVPFAWHVRLPSPPASIIPTNTAPKVPHLQRHPPSLLALPPTHLPHPRANRPLRAPDNNLALPTHRMRLQPPQIQQHVLLRPRRYAHPSHLLSPPTRHRCSPAQPEVKTCVR